MSGQGWWGTTREVGGVAALSNMSGILIMGGAWGADSGYVAGIVLAACGCALYIVVLAAVFVRGGDS